PLLVAGGAVPDELHVRLGLGQLSLHVPPCGGGAHDLGLEVRGPAGQLLELGVLGQAAQLVLELADASVERLQLEQPLLLGGVGSHAWSPWVKSGPAAPRAKSHGSVRTCETWISNLAAEASSSAIRRSASPGSQSDSLAKCPASTRYGVPPARLASSRASRAGW